MYWETAEGKDAAYPARQIIVRDVDGKCHALLITSAIRDSADLLQEIQRKGLEGCTFVECYTAVPEELTWVQEICSLFDVKMSWSDSPPFKPRKQKLKINFRLTDKYYRAVAKIAFHYTLWQCDYLSGNEEEFRGIKNYIAFGGNNKYVREIKGDLPGGLYGDAIQHLLVMEKVDQVVVRLQFFFGLLPTHFKVLIGNNPNKIVLIPPVTGHQLVYFVERDDQGQHGVLKPVQVIHKSLLL